MKNLVMLLVCIVIVCSTITAFADPAFTDEEKLEFTRQAFIDKLNSIDDWNTLKNLIQNINPTMVKNFLKNKLEDEEQNHADASSQLATKSVDYGDLADEIDAIP